MSERNSMRAGVPAALGAAAVTLVVQVAAGVIRHTWPFGPQGRNLNDMWGQFLPLHAHLWDLLHGVGPSDWHVDWSAGGGVPWLPDFISYLASPLAPLVALAPRDSIESTMWWLSVAKGCAAAAVMVAYLRTLHGRGNPVVLALLGAGYGLCGWAQDDASYMPMWLDGLIALPAIALAGEWARQRRWFVASAVVIAMCWWANFYTAFMASLAAALLLVIRCVAERDRPAAAARTVASFAARGVLGVGLASAVLLPLITAIRAGQPGSTGVFHPVSWARFAARALPGSEGVTASPSIAAGLLALVLALGLPWASTVSRARRAAYVIGLLGVLLSMQWPPTQIAWHGFATPNGSPFRQGFVVAGWLVVMAWMTLASGRPSPRALLGGSATTALLLIWALAGAGRGIAPAETSGATVALTLLGVVGALGTLVAGARRRSAPRAAWALLVAAVLVESTVAAVQVQDRVAATISGTDRAWGPQAERISPAVQQASEAWPASRAASGAGLGENQSLLTGLPGLDYYSSVMPAEVSASLTALGAPWSGYGRAVRDPGTIGGEPADPTFDALLAVGHRLVPGPGGSYWSVAQPAFPMIRLVPGARPTAATRPATPYAVRDQLLASPVHTVPKVTVEVDGKTRLLRRATTVAEAQEIGLGATCRPGERVYVRFLGADVTARQGDVERRTTTGGRVGVQAGSGLVRLGTVPVSGRVDVRLTPAGPVRLLSEAVGCEDETALRRQIADATRTAPQSSTVEGAHLQAMWSQPVTGDVVIATANRSGWTCTANDRSVPVGERGGLLSFPVSAVNRVSCDYNTPGLTWGVVLSLLCAFLLLGSALLRVVRRRGIGTGGPAPLGPRDRRGHSGRSDRGFRRSLGP